MSSFEEHPARAPRESMEPVAPVSDASSVPQVGMRRAVGLVAAGGALGTLARYGLTLAIPHDSTWPVAVAIANLTGAFALGWLAAWLASRIADPLVRQRRQLLLGTGLLGGYTTYSALAVDAADLIRTGEWSISIAYGLGTVLIGTAACLVGYILGTRKPDAQHAGGAS